jgi:1-acyl-sn-glycerol-3-phosphate acyltransferase
MSADLGPSPGWSGGLGHRLYEYGALWFGLGLLGTMSLAWSLLAVPLYYALPKHRANPLGRWAVTGIFRVYLGALALVGACRFDIRALDALRGEGPLVIAPNHPGLLDAPMVISRLPNLTCVMKADIVDNVFLGAGARLAGYIRNDAQLSMIRQAVAELESGRQLLLFPEGTRTSRWPINNCTGAAALIASRAKAPIQTLLIESDSPYLGKGWPLLRRPTLPISYRIRLGRRFDPPQQARVATRELEHYFMDELRNKPCFRPPCPPPAGEPGASRHT